MVKRKDDDKKRDEDDINLLVKTDDHERDIKILSDRLERLEAKYADDNKFAATFENISKNNLVTKNVIEQSFIYLIENNHNVQNKLKCFIDQSDRVITYGVLKRWGAAIEKIGLMIVGGVITLLFKKYF